MGYTFHIPNVCAPEPQTDFSDISCVLWMTVNIGGLASGFQAGIAPQDAAMMSKPTFWINWQGIVLSPRLLPIAPRRSAAQLDAAMKMPEWWEEVDWWDKVIGASSRITTKPYVAERTTASATVTKSHSSLLRPPRLLPLHRGAALRNLMQLWKYPSDGKTSIDGTRW